MEAARGQTDVRGSSRAIRGRERSASVARNDGGAGSRDVAFGLGIMFAIAFAAVVAGIIVSVT